VADLNEHLEEDEVRANDGRDKRGRVSRNQMIGLSKRLFYTHLQKYGVLLDEDEKTLINTVFSMSTQQEKFDYEKLDAAFEGVQSQLYALSKFLCD
jgi:hypothetical protein